MWCCKIRFYSLYSSPKSFTTRENVSPYLLRVHDAELLFYLISNCNIILWDILEGDFINDVLTGKINKNKGLPARKGQWGVPGIPYAITHNFVYFLGTLPDFFGHPFSYNQKAISTGYSTWITSAYLKVALQGTRYITQRVYPHYTPYFRPVK